MNKHIKESANSAFHTLRCLRKTKPFLPQADWVTVVQSRVLSKLDYGNAIITGTPKCHLAPMKTMYNAAARLITGSKWHDHISPILKNLNWLLLEGRCAYKTVCLTHRALHTTNLNYLTSKLTKAGQQRALRSTNSLLFITPKFKKESTRCCSFSGSAHKLWNSVPQALRCNPSYHGFKRDLKRWIFNHYFNT